MDAPPFRLTSLAHGGGCGCKLAPSVLRELMVSQPATQPFASLLVGAETSDDAAVWRLDDHNCIIATTDFFMPIVDDPTDFGRIAATNAISDIYAMGGTPILALAILGMPVGKIAPDIVREILQGGRAACAAAGIPVAGGHSIDCPEPVYGLAVIGTARPENIKRNRDARIGDLVLLTKPLGVGVYSAALKKDALSAENYAAMVASMTKLNRIGAVLGREKSVHAMTDVTGFGLLGHALEMAQGSQAAMTLHLDALPFLPDAAPLAQQGFITGASHRNWDAYGAQVDLPADCPDWRRALLTDPQTSGGLLIACAPDDAARLHALIAEEYPQARIVGEISAGPARLVVRR